VSAECVEVDEDGETTGKRHGRKEFSDRFLSVAHFDRTHKCQIFSAGAMSLLLGGGGGRGTNYIARPTMLEREFILHTALKFQVDHAASSVCSKSGAGRFNQL